MNLKDLQGMRERMAALEERVTLLEAELRALANAKSVEVPESTRKTLSLKGANVRG